VLKTSLSERPVDYRVTTALNTVKKSAKSVWREICGWMYKAQYK